MTATPDDSPLTSSQLRDVQDCLRRPLTGRKVLLPLGPQAFCTGSLQPQLLGGINHNDNQDDDTQDEQVTLMINGTRTLVSRRAAMDHIQDELDARRPKPPKAVSKQPPTKRNKPQLSPSTTAAAPIGPMFEIREELNEEGREINSEAINVTQQVQEWEKQVRQAKQVNEDDDDNDMGESKEQYSNMEITDDDDDDNLETIAEDATHSKSPITETEYESIVSRLDELAKLEEEAEANESKTSTPKLQALRNPSKSNKPKKNGWAKGFLNNSPSKKKTAKKAAVKKESLPPVQNDPGEQVSPAIPQPAAPTIMPAETIPPADTSSDDNPLHSTKRVGFSTDTPQVQEIPRVGTRSVRDIPKPPPRQQDALFAGSVHERPKKPRANRQNKAATSSATAPPQEKRLSRFAQQRQGLS